MTFLGRRRPSCIGLLVVAGAHMALVAPLFKPRITHMAQHVVERPAIQWLLLTPERTPPASSSPSASSSPRAPTRVQWPRRTATRVSIPVMPPSADTPAAPVLAPPSMDLSQATATPPLVSAADIIRIAKQDIAKISRDLSKEFPERVKAPLSTSQTRLEQGFDNAHAAARPDWYQAAKIEEITSGSSGGGRVYRISTALGAFCMTYPRDGGKPTYNTCP